MTTKNQSEEGASTPIGLFFPCLPAQTNADVYIPSVPLPVHTGHLVASGFSNQVVCQWEFQKISVLLPVF